MSSIFTAGRPAVAQDPWGPWPVVGARSSRAGTPAELVGLNGSRHRVWLQAIDPERAQAQLRLTPDGSVVSMRLDQLRSLSLVTAVDALAPGSPPQPAEAAGAFRIEFTDGQVLAGQAQACAELAAGVLVQQLFDQGRQRRHTLFSRAGVRRLQMLSGREAAPSVPPAQPSQQRLIAALQAQQVAVPEDLPQALEASGQLALARLGDLLVALGHLSEVQLASALALQQRQPGQALGQLLINEGMVSREQQRQALEHKAGQPFVDLNRFPVAEAALRCLPVGAAQSFEALPICFLNRQLVVVTAHILPPETLKDLSYRCQRPLVTALSLKGSLARHIEHHYERFGLAGPQWLD